MKKLMLAGALAIPLLGGAMAVVALRSQGSWTSGSADAVAAFQRGRAAEMKLYKNEAREHYEEAVRLDPDFVAAKLLLATLLPPSEKDRGERLIAEARGADLGRLSPSERFLVSYTLAKRDRKAPEAAGVLEAHLREHPDDAFALFSRCTDAWLEPDWEEAERCNRELLAVDPNWVLAYNYLGYIAMAQGRFSEAEKNFLAYKYIAPDQANPHDSLGALYTVLGRYDDAARELNEAVTLRPDFCASYPHLLLVAFLKRDAALADAALARAATVGSCPEKELGGMRCTVELWRRYLAGDPAGALAIARAGCLEKSGDLPVLVHRAALLAGDLAEAEALEKRPRKYLKDALASPEPGAGLLRSGLDHMEGVRLLADGRAAEAAAFFERADSKLAFRGEGQGIFKLINQLALADALRAMGAPERGDQVLAAVRAVNPHIEELFGSDGPLGVKVGDRR